MVDIPVNKSPGPATAAPTPLPSFSPIRPSPDAAQLTRHASTTSAGASVAYAGQSAEAGNSSGVLRIGGHASTAGPTGSRPFRSKKVRPCDACRKRKNRCAVPVEGEPCVECKQTGRKCTYLLPPPARPKKESVSLSPSTPPALTSSSTFSSIAIPPSLSITSPEDADVQSNNAALATLRSNKRPCQDSAPSVADTARKRVAVPSSSSVLASLDRDLPAGVEPCAVTATLTDDLLTHQTVGTSRQISSDRNRAQFILFHATPPHRPLLGDFEIALLRRIQSFLSSAVPTLTEDALLDHYLTFLHPALPVLPISPQHPLQSLPPSLRAVILVEALSYFPALRDKSEFAWRMIKEEKPGEKMLDLPKLSSLATAVLELSTATDPRGDYGLLAKTIAHAQLLGLHVDCQAWAIPEWEKSLRDRIWWCLRIHDAWASFLNSRPSHIQAGNTNVPLLPFPASGDPVESYPGGLAFSYSCRLAVIVARLQSEVSTLDKYGSASRAKACDELEKELNTLRESIKSLLGMASWPPGMDCFLFCLLALRCMIRRISIEVRIGLGSAFAPDGNTLSIFAEFVAFFSSLRESSFGGEQSWICYTSHILSSVLSSLIRLSLAAISSPQPPPSASISSHASAHHEQSTSHPSTPSPVYLLARLCGIMYAARYSFGWTKADAALNRAASVVSRLTSVMHADAASDDYSEVIAALQRTEPPEEMAHEAMPAGGSDALDALARLAHASESHDDATGDSGFGGAFEVSDALGVLPFVTEGQATGEPPGLFGLDAINLPDLDEWLNVLDQRQEWGFDANSPRSGWGISW